MSVVAEVQVESVSVLESALESVVEVAGASGLTALMELMAAVAVAVMLAILLMRTLAAAPAAALVMVLTESLMDCLTLSDSLEMTVEAVSPMSEAVRLNNCLIRSASLSKKLRR